MEGIISYTINGKTHEARGSFTFSLGDEIIPVEEVGVFKGFVPPPVSIPHITGNIKNFDFSELYEAIDEMIKREAIRIIARLLLMIKQKQKD